MLIDQAASNLTTLTLGTVQFGLPYGIANRSGQPDRSHVKSILKTAYDGGIRVLDTAAAYGTSEQVVGDALWELGLADQFSICTKIRVLMEHERASDKLCRKAIRESLEESLHRLRVQRLWCVLFHRDADYPLLDVLQEFQEEGWVQHIGISAANSESHVPEWLSAVSNQIGAIQVPGSLIDLRYLQHSGVQTFCQSGGIVFVRSIYLQGLLLLDEFQIPRHLHGILPVRRFLQKNADEAGIGIQELCLRFLLGHPGVSSLVVGMETVEQLHDNLKHWSKGPLPAVFGEAIRSGMPQAAPELLVPGLWESLRRQCDGLHED